MQINIPDSVGMLIIGLIFGIILGVGFFIIKRLFKKKVSLENIKEITENLDKNLTELNNNLKCLSNNVKSISDENNKLKKILETLENAKR